MNGINNRFNDGVSIKTYFHYGRRMDGKRGFERLGREWVNLNRKNEPKNGGNISRHWNVTKIEKGKGNMIGEKRAPLENIKGYNSNNGRKNENPAPRVVKRQTTIMDLSLTKTRVGKYINNRS